MLYTSLLELYLSNAHVSSWLDITPISRIITRCTQDISVVDDDLSTYVYSVAYSMTIIAISSGIVVSMTGWQMTIPALATIVLGFVLGQYYLVAQMPVKRLMSNAKAPVIGQVQTALIGLGRLLYRWVSLNSLSEAPSVSVRAYGFQSLLQGELSKKIDGYSRIAYVNWDISRCVAVNC